MTTSLSGLLGRMHNPDALRIAVAGPGGGRRDDGGASPSHHPKPHTEVPAGTAFVLRKIRDHLESKGTTGYVHLQRLVRIFARSNRRLLTLSVGDMKELLQRLGADDFSSGEVRMLFEHYGVVKDHQDTRDRNSLDVHAFMHAVRPTLSERRLAVVLRAFARLDTDGDGRISADDVASAYDASNHPEVTAGRVTADDALAQFLESFDVGAEVDGHVTQGEFVDHYTNISAAIASDDYFVLLISGVWHVASELAPRSGAQHVEEAEEQRARGPVPLRAAVSAPSVQIPVGHGTLGDREEQGEERGGRGADSEAQRFAAPPPPPPQQQQQQQQQQPPQPPQLHDYDNAQAAASAAAAGDAAVGGARRVQRSHGRRSFLAPSTHSLIAPRLEYLATALTPPPPPPVARGARHIGAIPAAGGGGGDIAGAGGNSGVSEAVGRGRPTQPANPALIARVAGVKSVPTDSNWERWQAVDPFEAAPTRGPPPASTPDVGVQVRLYRTPIYSPCITPVQPWSSLCGTWVCR